MNLGSIEVREIPEHTLKYGKMNARWPDVLRDPDQVSRIFHVDQLQYVGTVLLQKPKFRS